jgi:hypothetical protein
VNSQCVFIFYFVFVFDFFFDFSGFCGFSSFAIIGKGRNERDRWRQEEKKEG